MNNPDPTRAFRDYATRVSFNMSLSRNQVGHLAGIVMEIENEQLHDGLEFGTRSAKCAIAKATTP